MILRELFKKSAVILEGGNLASHTAAGEPTVGWTGVPGNYNAGKIDSKNRAVMQPAVKQLLVDINNLFTRQYGRPIWSPELIEKEVETFISGSSKWFMQLRQPNPNFNPQQPVSDVNPKEIGIADKDFQRVKKKVGDIDTQIDRRLEPQIEEFLHKNIGANIGSASLLGTKKGSDQWLALWQIHEPPITLQVDLEFSDYTTDARGFEVPTEWAQVSHGSAWEDLELGMKGVFRQWLYRSLAKVAPTEKYVAKITGAGKNKGMKVYGGDDGRELVVDIDSPPPPLHDANFSFAVASVGGGGVRAKYRQPTPQENVPLEINGIPVMVPLTTAESEYIKDMSAQFEQFFGVPAKGNETKMMASLVGTVELMKQFFTPDQQQVAVQEFLKINFGKGAQMIDADDPTSDFKTKMTAIDYVLDQTGMQNLRKQAIQMAKEYENTFNAKKQPQPLAEAEVKAQLRKGMPHLHDLKPADLLDLLDEIHDGNGNFKLQNIPLNVKVDGFGGRFGKNSEGKPFMGTSRTEPRYQAGFVAYHKQKGTTDPEVLGRAQLFDQLFNEMMNAVQLVDSKLGPDFLLNKQVTCEVLYLPFATETPEGKLKFVGIHYDKLPEGVHLALVPFRVVDATTGEDLPDSNKFIKELLKVGSNGRVMFIDNSLTQQEGLDVTALVPPLENIEQLKAMLASNKLEAKRQVKAALEPVAAALEKAIINDPNIIGKDMLGKDYEGIVINSRLGPIKVTSQEQRDVITAKNAAKVNARTERPRGEAKTAVVAIGSFVGHIGHEQLWDYTTKKAAAVGGDPYLFIGNAQGKDDPIPPAVKVQTWHKLYPEYAKNISTVTQDGGSLLQKIKHELINPLPGKPPRYDNVIIMVGEDQAGLTIPQALMKAVNKFPGYEHVKVTLEPTPRGTGMSFTRLRNILKDANATPDQQFAEWAKGFDVNKLGAEWIEHLMDITRKGMGIQQPQQQPVQQQPVQQQPVPVAEQRLFNALVRPESTESRLDEFDLFKKSAPMKTPSRKPGASSAEMRKFFQNQANKDKPGLKPKSVDMDNPQKVYVKYADEEIEDNDVMSRMARDLTGPGAPDAKRRAQRDQQRQKDRAQSDGRDHGPKWDVAEGPQDDPEDYRAHLLKTLPRMMNFLSKNVKGWKPTEEQYLAAIETGYQVMKHTGDVQQAGRAMSDELNTLHRMSQGQQGVAEGSIKDVESKIRAHDQRKADREQAGDPYVAHELHSHNVIRKQLLDKRKKAQAEYHKRMDQQGVAEGTEQSLQKKIQAKRDALGLAREQRRMRGQHQQGPREIKLQAEIDKLSTELHRQKQGVAEAPKSAAVRLGNAIQRVQGKTAASQARSVIPSSIPKPEPKKDEKVAEKMMPASMFAGSKKNKLGPAGQWKNTGPKKNKPAQAGDLVGGMEEGLRDSEDNPCWKGYKPVGTKKKAGKTVPNCVPVSEDVENIMAKLIDKIVVNEAIQNNKR